MPLTQDLFRAKQYRTLNPELANISDRDLADIVYQQTGELGDLRGSSALGRTIARGSNLLNTAGQKVEEGMTGLFGDSYGSRVAARAGNIAVSNVPEYLLNLGAARVLPQSKMGAVGLGALNFGLGYGRTQVETGDRGAALGAGAGNVTSMIGALAGATGGARLGRGGPAIPGVKPTFGERVGGAVGGFVGSMPGDAIGIATQPGGWEEFRRIL